MFLLCFILVKVLSFTNMHEISYTHNVNIVDHMSRINTTKIWIKLLQFPLQEILMAKQHYLSTYVVRLPAKIIAMMQWCVPRSQVKTPTILYHVKHYAPCGYIQIAADIKKDLSSWKIVIPANLQVQMNFLVFEMDVSQRRCEQSAFFLSCYDFAVSQWRSPDKWIFCGYRKPWYETVPSSTVNMSLRHRNVQQRSNITLMYTSLEREVANIYIMHANISQHLVLYPVNIMCNLPVSQDVRNWLIVVEYGFRIRVSSLFVCCSSNRVIIYDGFQDTFSMRYKEDSAGESYHRYLNLYSNYFQMTLYLYVEEMNYLPYHHILLKANFDRSFLRAKQALIGSISTIANNGSILYDVYSLAMMSDGKMYPNVSFNVRKFYGWNEGSCKFGGYLIVEAKYYLDDGVKYKLGPFCSKSFSTEPFVGTHGHKNIIFGKREIYIILYAFGPLYALDIDLVVVPSMCEGVFELPYSCLHSSLTKQHIFNHDNNNYQVKCYKTIRRSNKVYSEFSFSRVVNCIILQGISYNQFEEERYEIISTVNAEVKVTRALPFLPLGETDAKSAAFVSFYGTNTDVYNITHHNSSFQTTVDSITILQLRIINWATHQRFTYSISVNATVPSGITCSNSSHRKEHLDTHNGKLYKTIVIPDICGSLLLQLPCVLLIKLYIGHTQFDGYIMHIEISKNDLNRWKISDTLDTVTIANYDRGVCHTVNLTSQMVRLVIRRSFGIIVEKTTSTGSFVMEFRIEKFKVYSGIGLWITGNQKYSGITVSINHFSAISHYYLVVHRFIF